MTKLLNLSPPPPNFPRGGEISPTIFPQGRGNNLPNHEEEFPVRE